MSQFEEPILFDCLWQLVDEKKYPFMIAPIEGVVRQCMVKEVTSHIIGGRGQIELYIMTYVDEQQHGETFIIWNDEADEWTITKNSRGEWWLERAAD